MFQKCPLCNGTGIHTHILNTGNPTIQCDVCKGQKIISQITGKPPANDISIKSGFLKSVGTSPYDYAKVNDVANLPNSVPFTKYIKEEEE